ncbi:amino acid adenylation domain-containing protein [Gottfriedia acidiceleris]|uniref:amino acid adenylation domain-containing protein n=1 Tax=Gottfriedia acidiceleris TaxID=371036 RepID=UPI002F266001
MSNNIKFMYPLTPLQQGMLLITQTSENKDQYSVHMHLCLKGDVSLEIFEKAFQEIVDRHDILRTVFVYKKIKTPLQVVLKKRETKITVVDFKDRNMNQADMDEFWSKAEPFDFEKGMLMNLAWFQFKDQDIASFRFHHIILDGWSVGIVLKDFEDLINGRECSIKTRNLLPFKEYIESIQKMNKLTTLTYWENYLSGYEEYFHLVPKNRKETEIYQKHVMTVDEEVFTRMDSNLKKLGISVNTALQTAWGLVLQKHLYSDDVLFGAVVSGRNLPLENIETGVGLFINTLPVRIKTLENETILDVLKKVQLHAEESSAYEFCSLSDIKKGSSLTNDLFDHIMAFENYPFEVGQDERASKVKVDQILGVEKNNYGLNIKAVLQGHHFSVEFSYNTGNFTETEIKRLMSHLMTVFKSMADNLDLKVEQLDLLNEEERNKLLYKNNDTFVDISDENLTDFLSKSLMKNPSYKAISGSGSRTYSYEEVEKITNQIARLMKDKGLEKEDVVALHMKRSPDVMLAMLGLLKSGVAFLPIDTNTPSQRIDFMLEDSSAKILVTEDENLASHFHGVVLKDLLEESNKYSDAPFRNISSDDDLAYIIYTSGSTGNPKGTMMQRRGLINLTMDMQNRYDEENIAIVAISSISFDMFLYEYTYCLGRQGEFVIANEEERMDMEELFRLFEDKNIQSMITTPSRIAAMLHHPKAPKVFKEFKTLIIGGESLKADVLDKAIELVGGELQNAYGPTETTVICTVKENLKLGDKITIGKPLLNTSLLVLDKNLNMVPIGAIGELYIVTPGILRGYLHNQELTDRVKRNCKQLGHVPMYKSGDFVKWTEDGEIEFIGRIDGQHKIRGQRIELDEIDNKISAIDGITDVVTQIIGEKQEAMRLVSFFSGEHKEELELKEKLKEILPIYMVPDYLIYLEEIPTNNNGKADKKKLKEYFDSLDFKKDIKEATSEIQKAIREIWCEILGRTDLSVDSNFYEMGGNSLLAMSLASRLSTTFKKTIKVSDVLRNLTIIEQEMLLQYSEQVINIPELPETKMIPLSSAEKRMYVVEKQSVGSNAYNTFMVMEVKGILDEGKLQKVLNALAVRHESLRVQFVEDTEGIHKEIIENVNIPIYNHKMEKLTFLEQGSHLIKEFNLLEGPLWEVHVIQLEDREEELILLLNFSHIIMDGTSMDLLMEDFKELMNDKIPSSKVRKYSDYAVFEEKLDMQVMEEYFVKELKNLPDTALVTDFPRSGKKSFRGKTLHHRLSESMSHSLKDFCKKEQITPSNCLMGLYQLLLMKFGNKDDFTIGTIVANRDLADTRHMIGMFANTLAVRFHYLNEESIIHYLKNYQNHFQETLKHQRYPFELLVKNIDRKEEENKEIFHHLFVYQYLTHGTAGFKTNEAVFTPCMEFKVPETSKFDITFEIMDYGETIEVLANYNTDLYHEKTIKNLLVSYEAIIESTITNSGEIGEINVISASQKTELSTWGSGMKYEYSKEDMVVRRLNHLAEMIPLALAMKMNGEVITYADLKKKSDILAHKILSSGVEKNAVCAIYMDRGPAFVISMLAILKARCGYLPIDISLPKERISYMLEDSNCQLVITDGEIDYASIHIGDVDWNHEVDVKEDWSLEDPSYIIYTSGTTGKPKGVQLNQQSLTNFVKGLECYFHFKQEDVLLSLASVSFDMFSSEVWMSLYSGMCLVITDNEERYSIENTVKIMAGEKVTTILTTPSRIENSFETIQKYGALKTMKQFIFGGEPLKDELIEKIQKENAHITVYNAYGPTEATMHCTVDQVMPGEGSTIGRPIPNVSTFILDDQLKRMIPGALGELCIGGDALADEYINLDEITNEKFVHIPGIGRVYRTGDLARWNKDGKLEYVGRIDSQVKINGHRVEIGEIEQEILRLTFNQPCKVIAKMSEGKWILAAFSTSDADLNEIHEELSKHLPYYMVPKYILKVNEIPVTINGKVDEKALEKMLDDKKDNDVIMTANTEMEKHLEAAIKEKIQGISDLNMNVHFMDIGGDSFKVIEVISALRTKGYTISITDFMNQPDLKRIATKLKKIGEESIKEIEVEEILSPMHQKILEHNTLSAVNGFTQTVALENDSPLDIEKLKEILVAIMDEHPMLRSFYPESDGKRIHAYGTSDDRLVFESYVLDQVSEKQVSEIARQSESLIDIEKSLFRVTVINGKNIGYCIISLHHFLLDTVSWMILLEELTGLYNGTKDQLQPSSSTFHQWLVESVKYAKGNEFDKEADHWDQLQKNSSSPFSYNYMKDMTLWEHTLSKEESEELFALKNEWQISLDAILLSAFGNSLSKMENKDEVLIEMESHGRNFDYGVLDLSHTIGWFTSPFPMKIKNAGAKIHEAVLNMEKELKTIPNKGRAYSIKRYLHNDRGYSMEPKYVFNNLGEIRYSLENKIGLRMSSIPFHNIPPQDFCVNYEVYCFFRITQGRLSIGIQYNHTKYDEESFNRLQSDFMSYLLSMKDLLQKV